MSKRGVLEAEKARINGVFLELKKSRF